MPYHVITMPLGRPSNHIDRRYINTPAFSYPLAREAIMAMTVALRYFAINAKGSQLPLKPTAQERAVAAAGDD